MISKKFKKIIFEQYFEGGFVAKKKIDWKGIHIPVITPFKEDYSIDVGGLKKLVDYYIEQGATGIVPCGTTGESPTLSPEEHGKVIEIVIDQVNGRVPVMAGTGSNSTKEAIELTKHAQDCGADATLQVGPYYNKPTPAGMLAHFKAIANSTNLPVFIYNIPGRTGKNIEPKTILELGKIDNIIGVKDAAADMNQTMDLANGIKSMDKKFYLLTGEDHLLFSTLCLGGDGAISATGHVVLKEQLEMAKAVWNGNIEKAREIHFKILPIVRTLFIESNPVPVKESLKMMGLPAGKVRLPLVEMLPQNREILKKELLALGKI